MTIPVHSNESFRGLKRNTTKMFEHIPPRFWGVKVCHGYINSLDNRARLYNASVFYYGAQLFDIFVYEDDSFYNSFADKIKTRTVEPTQQTIKLAEELVKYSISILIKKPNFGSNISLLYDKLYRKGVDDGREALQFEIKKILDIKV